MAEDWRKKFREHPAFTATLLTVWGMCNTRSLPLLWRIWLGISIFVVALMCQQKYGLETPKASCVVIAAMFAINVFVSLRVEPNPSPLGRAIFWALFVGAVAGVIRMFTVPPLSRAVPIVHPKDA